MANAPEPRRTTEARDQTAPQAGEAVKQAASRAREIAQTGFEIASEAAHHAAQATLQTASEERQAIGASVSQVAEAAAPAADASFSGGRRLVETSARITDLMRSASNDTAADVQALTVSYTQLGQGLLRMQQTYLDLVQQALTRARKRPQDFLRCRSLEQVAEVQRDVYVDGVTFMLESSTTMIRMAGEIAQGAARPLEARAQPQPAAE